MFGDDLIGETVVDLDDRFFCPDWQSIEEKPVEYRQLRHPSSSVSQGVIKMWVELKPTAKSTGEDKVYDIRPRPQKEYEVRLVVWDTKELEMMDAEGTCDAFIRCFFDTKDAKETDTHFRNQDGKASFNYRLLYKFKAPASHYLLTIQAWDRDFFTSNELIGEIQIDMRPLFEDVIETGRTMSVNKKYFEQYLNQKWPDHGIKFEDDDSFWVPMSGLDEKTQEMKVRGYVRLGFQVMP